MLLKRTLVAVGFIPVLISLILWSKTAFFILVCLIIGVSLFEFYQRMRKEGENIFLPEGILLGLLIPVGVYLRGEGVLPILLVFIILFLCLRQFIYLVHVALGISAPPDLHCHRTGPPYQKAFLPVHRWPRVWRKAL